VLVIEFVVGIAAGVLAAMTGGGGGLLFVPFLLMVGLPVSEAVATSNVGILITTAAGTLSNARAGEVPWTRVLALGIPAVLVAPLGSLIAMRMPAVLLLILLALLNVANAILAGRPVGGPTPADVDAESPAAAVAPRSDTVPRTIVTGGSGGLLAGLFGIGGGLVVVPLQVIWLSTPIKVAVRISLAVIVLSSAGAIMGHLVGGGGIDWNSGVALGLGGLVGAPLGARFLRMVTPTAATRLLQVVLLVVAVQLVVKVIQFA
jgi:uncharacterized membrane protein YfcA